MDDMSACIADVRPERDLVEGAEQDLPLAGTGSRPCCLETYFLQTWPGIAIMTLMKTEHRTQNVTWTSEKESESLTQFWLCISESR